VGSCIAAAKRAEVELRGTRWEVIRGWHVFRHSYASINACRGVDQRVIDADLGHQTEEMRKRYQHLFPKYRQQVHHAVFG
jgi:integrase